MLSAILHGKAGRIATDKECEQSWRDVFRLREDLLTAVFFSRIRYLSAEGEQKVLSLLIGPDNTKQAGEVKEYIYWPRLTGLENRSFVEPDVLIRCENAMILVEVKPPFGGVQYTKQWRDEIESLILQKDNEESEWDIPDTIHFVALGNNARDWQTDGAALQDEFYDSSLFIHAIEWEQINHGVTKLLDGEEGRDNAVYADWRDAFALFGLTEPPMPFTDLLRLRDSVAGNWQLLFKNISTYEDSNTIEYEIKDSTDWTGLFEILNKCELRVQLWK